MNCARCHRPLKQVESVRRGMGPVCWRRYQDEMAREDPSQLKLFPVSKIQRALRAVVTWMRRAVTAMTDYMGGKHDKARKQG